MAPIALPHWVWLSVARPDPAHWDFRGYSLDIGLNGDCPDTGPSRLEGGVVDVKYQCAINRCGDVACVGAYFHTLPLGESKPRPGLVDPEEPTAERAEAGRLDDHQQQLDRQRSVAQ